MNRHQSHKGITKIIPEKVTFKGSLGHVISARLDRPLDGTEHSCAIYAPCFTCTKDIHAAVRISTSLAEKGIATLRLDFTGLGESGGEFIETSFSSNVADLLAAIEYLKSRGQSPKLLIGHSFGGTASLTATHLSQDIKAVVTINSPCYPRHASRHFTDTARDELFQKGQTDIQIAGRTFRISKNFADDLEAQDMDKILPKLNAALLVLHAPEDPVVHIKNASYIFSGATHPKSFISLDGMDHLISEQTDANYIANLISVWSSHYIY